MSDKWCDVDDCPSAICGGPHREVETTFGVELLRLDQEPIGQPVTPADVSAAHPADDPTTED